MNIILLSGGSGQRLWPLSNGENAKQFLQILTNDNGKKESMIQRIFRQIKETGIFENIVIATNHGQVDLIKSQIGDVDIVIEPEKRNTYPAIMLASAYLKYVKGVKNDEPLIVLPVDVYADNGFFESLKNMKNVIKYNDGLTLIGVKPDVATDKYGYIVCNNDNRHIKNVTSFVEKPSIDMARELIENGAYYNAGVFGFKLGFVTNLLKKTLNVNSYDEVYNNYSLLNNNSFDYEIVEKCKDIKMLEYDGKWSDLGTWDSLIQEMDLDMAKNVYHDELHNTNIINGTGKPIIVLGIDNAVIVDTNEGLLIAKKDKCSELKKYLKK